MENFCNWLKNSVLGIIILGCLGSAICAFIIFLGKKLYNYLLPKYKKYAMKKNYINGFIMGTICLDPSRIAVYFTKRLFSFFIAISFFIISVISAIVFIIHYDKTFVILICIIMSVIICIFSLINIIRYLLHINLEYEILVIDHANKIAAKKNKKSTEKNEKK